MLVRKGRTIQVTVWTDHILPFTQSCTLPTVIVAATRPLPARPFSPMKRTTTPFVPWPNCSLTTRRRGRLLWDRQSRANPNVLQASRSALPLKSWTCRRRPHFPLQLRFKMPMAPTPPQQKKQPNKPPVMSKYWSRNHVHPAALTRTAAGRGHSRAMSFDVSYPYYDVFAANDLRDGEVEI
jgi:hypothetical protein